jgi:hypothetical protein
MSDRPFLRSIPIGILLIVVAACGSSTASTAPSGSASTQASAAEASSAAPSSAEPSASGPSSAIPSFVLPSGAKDLEAILPDQLCGAKAIKASMSGDQFASTADAQFKATLQAVGKQPSDVAFAFAFSTGSNCSAGIFRVKGIDQNLLQQAFLAEAQKKGTTYPQKSVGGKDVYVSDASSKTYSYFKGDGVIFVSAKDEASAAGILQQLP